MLDRTKNDPIRELSQDKLFALQNPMLLDGRVSSYPASATRLFGDRTSTCCGSPTPRG